MYTALPVFHDGVDPSIETIAVLDMTVRLRITNESTDGGWSLSEWTLPPYSTGLPIHWHARTQKLCYVLNGMLAWTVDQQTFTVSANDCVLIPTGARHSFFNPSAAPATLLMWSLPGGVEQMIAEVTSVPVATRTLGQYDYFYDLHV
jgi:mannose-6-phosphate isomerase-like protein (cupin superfamily)